MVPSFAGLCRWLRATCATRAPYAACATRAPCPALRARARRAAAALLAAGSTLLPTLPAAALTDAQALRMAQGDTDARIAAIAQAIAQPDPAVAPFLQALRDGSVKVTADAAYVIAGERATRAGSGKPVPLPADAEDAMVNNRLRGEIESALGSLALASPDAAQRAAAIVELRKSPDASRLPAVERAIAAERDPRLHGQLQLLRAAIEVGAGDAAHRMEAARALGASGDPSVRALLMERIGVEPDASVRARLEQSLADVQSRLAWGERLAALFTGLSLGSVLVLVALGLAITYGLMGVINMAHGELMMIGAYATWGVQSAVRQSAPALFGGYLLLAVPVAFAAAALVGAVMERAVIRHLYGRPLETLLATWGLSLVLIQAVRSLFGAQNVAVENPSWLSGGIAVLPNLTLPLNRLAILAFTALVVAGMALLLARTRLGLFVRGVTQNRRMAACTGIDTARIDTLAFAIGSGIAGVAGCALSQIGNVGPDLGQSYIVDAFMVVVLGGVGQLAGTVYAGLGLGVVNKLLEGWTGAVLAKIIVLMIIVVVIQKRPQGLFALKGREA